MDLFKIESDINGYVFVRDCETGAPIPGAFIPADQVGDTQADLLRAVAKLFNRLAVQA